MSMVAVMRFKIFFKRKYFKFEIMLLPHFRMGSSHIQNTLPWRQGYHKGDYADDSSRKLFKSF